MSYDYFGTATADPRPASGLPAVGPRATAGRRRLALVLLLVAVIGAAGYVATRGRERDYTRQSVHIPEGIGGYSLKGRAIDMTSEPIEQSFVVERGVTEYVAGVFVADRSDPPQFTVRAYRIPSNRARDPARVLAEEFSGDAKFPDVFGPTKSFPSGPLGGALECKRIRTKWAGCNWAAGEVVGNVIFITQDLDAAAALTLQIRAAVQR